MKVIFCHRGTDAQRKLHHFFKDKLLGLCSVFLCLSGHSFTYEKTPG